MDSYRQQSAITSWLEGRPNFQTTYTTLVVSITYITGTYFVKYPIFLLPNTEDVGPLQLKVGRGCDDATAVRWSGSNGCLCQQLRLV